MEIKKALTFRASSIGDCLMGKYFLENVHAAYPDARCAIIVGSRGEMIRDLFTAYPWLEIIEANRRSPLALFSLLKNFHGSDLVVTQYAGKPGGKFSLASKLIARVLAKRGGLVGFVDVSRWNRFLYDRLVPVRSDIAVVEHDRAALRTVGVSVSLPFPVLEFIQNDFVFSKFNLEVGKYIVVHFFSGNVGRGLHPDRKRELLLALSEKLPGVRLVISGSVADRDEAVYVAEKIPAVIIAGKATLQELMNIIARSHGVVSLDTGVAHITAQLRKPLIVMSSCLGVNWWFSEQYGDNAPIIAFSRADLCVSGHTYKKYPDCLAAINMREVAKKAAEITL